ncbi:MAG: Gfo/Idh/MocA family oxidoreductase [Pirellulales bacterium]|nr:Gfo/Idh/MocA family oxidoreductase [Pirellulales bacterium]
MKLRIGLVGLGEVWQTRHAPALRTMSDRFEVRAVCDQVSHRAEQAAAEFDADAVDGYRTLAAREDIDAVLILSPQWYGALPILAACDSAKAVYCAVGLDLEFEETQQVKLRIEESGIAFMAEFPRRHAPATIRLKELIATRLGTPRLVFCHQRSAAETSNHTLPVRPPNHFSARHLVELVDWCCYVVDRPPRLVTGMMHRTGCDAAGDDYQMMSLDFSEPEHPGTGAVAQISCGRYIPAAWQEAVSYRPLAMMQVSCMNGVAFIDLPATLVWFDEAGRHQESLDSERPIGEQLLAHFHRTVTSLVRRKSELEDACLALQIVQQARRAHQEGRRIAL